MNAMFSSKSEVDKRHLGVQIDRTWYRALRLQAAKEDRTISGLVRDAIARYMAQADIVG